VYTYRNQIGAAGCEIRVNEEMFCGCRVARLETGKIEVYDGDSSDVTIVEITTEPFVTNGANIVLTLFSRSCSYNVARFDFIVSAGLGEKCTKCALTVSGLLIVLT
jgi:hypothetical protein